jgi:hypothetical protein
MVDVSSGIPRTRVNNAVEHRKNRFGAPEAAAAERG